METIWSTEIHSLGWPAPIPDQGEGGDTRFDVYLMELFSKNLGGYVSPDGGFVGDNPATSRTELQAAYGYLVLENDFIDPNPPGGLKVWPPDQWMKIIAAHEFNHVLQIGINGSHPMSWWYEATANWMETQVFPNLPDNLISAGAVFKSPDTCMLRYGGVNRVEDGLHWYGMWVFNQSLAEQFGAGVIRDIWLAMADKTDYWPFDEVFVERGTTFEDEVRRFALNVLLRNFTNGTAYPTARLDAAVDAPGEWTPANGVGRYAMEYIGLNLNGLYTVTVTSDDPGIEGIVVGMRGTTADVYSSGKEITVDFGQYDTAYLMVLNLTRPPNEAGCATAQYSYAVQEAAATPPSAAAYNINSPAFEAPRVEALTDTEDAVILDPLYETEYNIRDEIKQVDLPFKPITPHGKPAGYELDSVYGVNADEQDEDFRTYNAPSGGIVAQMLYYNSEGRLLRITESRSLYGSIGEWMAINNLEFQPGVQVWTTGNTDTAVIDRSGGSGGPYLVAFIADNRFLAIDGDAPLDAMLDMAARFSASTSSELPDPRRPFWDGLVMDVVGK
jgi:hypothetical protein